VTAGLPRPLAVDGAVANDAAARTLVVRLSENAGGYARLLWRQGYEALVKSEESGWRTGPPAVWAGAPGSDRIAFAVPGDRQTLRFYFQPGEPAYQKLLDRETSHILNVKFHNRSRP
jgi:hypothetical protein